MTTILGKSVTIICSLSPEGYIVERTNQGPGKVKNLMSYLKSNELFIMNFYTDDLHDDAAVVQIARTTYLVEDGKIVNTISNNL